MNKKQVERVERAVSEPVVVIGIVVIILACAIILFWG